MINDTNRMIEKPQALDDMVSDLIMPKHYSRRDIVIATTYFRFGAKTALKTGWKGDE